MERREVEEVLASRRRVERELVFEDEGTYGDNVVSDEEALEGHGGAARGM